MSREQMKARLEAVGDVDQWYAPEEIQEALEHAGVDAQQIGPDSMAISHLPTDLAKLHAALDAVEALHRPEKRWEPYAEAGYSFLTREQALEAAGEEDLGTVAMEAGPQFFEVCKECARVESEQLDEIGEEWGYRESLWPCPTFTAIRDAIEGKA